jgi:hypothetical protein
MQRQAVPPRHIIAAIQPHSRHEVSQLLLDYLLVLSLVVQQHGAGIRHSDGCGHRVLSIVTCSEVIAYVEAGRPRLFRIPLLIIQEAVRPESASSSARRSWTGALAGR